MGNVIQCQSIPTQHKHRERTGKGGPVQETYTYTRTVAIRIAEAAPLDGEFMLRRAWMNGKLALDRTGTGTIDAESAKLLGQITFYPGNETQLPDPDLEALPSSDGGGVGNVPAHRGTCYVVLRNVDVTQTGGALPQFLWEVASCGTETAAATEWAITYPTSASSGTFKLSPDGEDWSATDETPVVGSDSWNPTGGVSITANNGAFVATCIVPASGGVGAAYRSPDGVWTECSLSSALNSSSGDTAWTGTHWMIGVSGPRTMRSTDGITFENIPGATGDNQQDFLGYAIAATDSAVLGYGPLSTTGWLFSVNSDGSGQVRLDDPPSGYLVISPAMCSDGATVLLAGIRGAGPYTVGIVKITGGGSYSSITSPFGSYASTPGVVVHYGLGQWWIAVNDDIAHGATLETLTLDPHTLSANVYCMDDDGTKLIVGGVGGMLEKWTAADDWEALISGTTTDILGIVSLGSSYSGTPVPDAPGYYVDDITNEVVGNGADVVTPCTPGLDEIVADWCERVEVIDYDVSSLSSITVRGISIKQPADAAGCIQSAQAVHFFDFPEWGDSGETGTKLRAVPRGGASSATITDDDLVDTDDDETTRAQQVEFPRKLNLIAPDPESNYETIKQTSERESENVKATGEITISTPFVMTRNECARVAEVMHKVAWEQALGTMKCELPEEYTRLVPSDIITRGGRRTRIDKTILGDGTIQIEATRDRARAYLSNATGSDQITPPVIGGIRGPTMFHGLNLPSLRTSDNVPGMYIGICGRLPAWAGCDLYLSVDGGASEQMVATIIDPSIMGRLTAGIGTADEPLSIRLWNDDELDSVTSAQLLARMNAFAVTTSGVSEIGQFKTPTDTGDREWDLTDLSRGLLGTTAATHIVNDDFIVLDGSLLFLPIDISHAGKTLIFRPVTRGTDPAENLTYEVVFLPQFTSVTVSSITVGGDQITVSGQPIYVVISNA